MYHENFDQNNSELQKNLPNVQVVTMPKQEATPDYLDVKKVALC